MKTNRVAWLAAAIALLGCSSSTSSRVRPASTPLFESNTRTDEVDSGPVEAGRPSTAPVPPKARLSDAAEPDQETTLDTEASRAAAAAPPAGTQGGAQERQRICDELRRGARTEVEETDDGARLWLRPHSAADATRLRKAAHELAATTASDSNTTVSAAPCGLYQLLAAGADVRTNVLEDGAVRIEVRSPDRASRGHVRDELRRFAGTPP